MTIPRVLLADDHTLVLEGFRRIVEQRCEVVGRSRTVAPCWNRRYACDRI